MADELIDIYDENNRPLGYSRMKSEAHRDGLWHRAAHVFLYDRDGNVLLQLRNRDKDVNPGRWSPAAAGHVGANESVATTAVRETEEEIGISFPEGELGEPIIRSGRLRYPNGIVNAEFKYLYFVRRPIVSDDIVLQESEVSDVRILPIDELERTFADDAESFSYEGDTYWEAAFIEIRNRLRTVQNDNL